MSDKRFAPVDSDSESSNSGEDRKKAVSRRQWFEESSDEEEEKRIVRSQKDKKWEALATHCKNIKNKLRIQDFVSIIAAWDELTKQIEKSKNVIEQAGLPVFFVRTLVRLEDAIAEVSKEAQKKMSSTNSKAYIKLKLNLKKYNKQYEEEIAKFRAAPEASEESESSESSEEEESEEASGSEEESEEEWGSGSEEEQSEDDRDMLDAASRRAFWTIKKPKEGEEEKEKKEKPTAPKPKPKVVEEVKKEEVKIEYTADVIAAKIKELTDIRGRKAVNPKEQVDHLKELLGHCENLELKIQLLQLIVRHQFDSTKNTVLVIMPRDLWLSVVIHLNSLLEIFSPSKEDLKEDLDDVKKSIIQGLSHSADRLNEELQKALKSADPQSTEYIERLSDHLALDKIIRRIFKFYEKLDDKENLAKMAIILLEQIHYVQDSLIEQMRKRYSGHETDLYIHTTDSEKEISRLADIVYNHGDSKQKVAAALMQAYHHALHSRFLEAKSLFLKTDFSEKSMSEPNLQVFYNRTLVQIGLSAFYNGFIEAAFITLNEIVSTHRLKELLAQTASSTKEKTPQQERDDRKRLMPYHMHIRTELVETAYFICAMIIDVPRIAQNPLDPEQFTLSKYFKRLLDYHERMALSGPAEGFRETILEAALALRKGKWDDCFEHLNRLNTWKWVPNAAEVKTKITKSIKESALSTYILTYGDHYESFSKTQLAKKFAMSEKQVEDILTNLIVKNQLEAAWEGEVIALHFTKQQETEFLADQIKEKSKMLAEINDKLQEFKGFLAQVSQEQMSRKQQPAQKKKKPIVNRIN